MNADAWWERRVGCSRAMLSETYGGGFGELSKLEPRLAAALGDLLSRPGSMVRGVAAYLLGIEMGLAEGQARSIACGIDYLHSASLVFDDLPSMDDAELRRGAPALHRVHGEPVAMLAALALINRGYALLWQGINGCDDAARRQSAGEWIDRMLGVDGLVGGQAHDLRGWRGGQDAGEVGEVAVRKTSSLLRLALVLPAVVGRGGTREIQLLDRLGTLRGIVYQAADDLKDVLADPGTSGKSVGRDDELGRPSVVAAEGVAGAMVRCQRLLLIGDRVAAQLPGAAERWGMLRLLRVTPPASLQAIEPAV